MRSMIAIPVIIAVASVAPAVAAPTAPAAPASTPDSEAISVKGVLGDVASVASKALPFLFLRRELENALMERSLGVDYTTIPRSVEPYWLKNEFTARAAPSETATEPGSQAISVKNVLGDVASVASKALPFLFFRRALEDELMAHGIDYTTIPRPMDIPAWYKSGFATRAAPSEAFSWKQAGEDALNVATTVAPFFFKRELDDELLARALEEGPGLARFTPASQELCAVMRRSFYEGPGPVRIIQKLCGTSKRSILDELD